MSRRLIDPYGRVIDYMRVSITDLCNLRCVYCMPPEGVKLLSHNEILSYEEILQVTRVAVELGIRKIRITGGEPLVRRGVIEFLSALNELAGLADIGLTTNGILLARMAKDLKIAGLDRINVSLDSMRRETFKAIAGHDRLDDVLDGIRTALAEGFDPVKINVVLLQGINEQDVPHFARLTLHMPLHVRFIERMPFAANHIPDSPDSFSARRALEIIESEVGKLNPLGREPLDGPATMFALENAQGRIGIIDPVTGHFCGTCNRLRLTARGTFRPCLLGTTEIDIKTALREGASDARLAEIIRQAVLAKPMSHLPRVPEMNESMSRIGG